MAKIGIDLGTTFSCVAIYRNQQVEVIPNDNGKRTTPSIVSFYENQRLIGEAAKSLMGINPQNTIYGIKRLIGRRFDEPIVQDDIARWPFEVIDDQNRPNIKVQYKNANTFLHPEEVSAMILEKMKEIAETYLGDKVEAAVITVPAYFNDGQRKATKQAAEIAQLKVLRIINEPTAAAIAYGLNNKLENENDLQKVVIFDFGGGTLDVTVLVIEDGVFDVRSTNGDTHLGGEDFDNRLVVHCLSEIKNKFKKKFAKNEKALNKLKTHCELAKINLSTSEATTINIPSLIDGEDFNITISREFFDQLTAELIDKVMQPVQDALKEANFDVSEISNVVLVGGSTKIVQIQKKLKDFFPRSRINMNINPDEAVAMGAAIHAAKLAGTDADELREIVLMDITPLSLGIQVAGGNMAVIIPRNTTVPVTKNKTFTTMKDNQTTVSIQVYEGERPLTHYNNFLGEVKLSGITPDKVGVPQIEVNFHIDSDGVLNCTAIEKREGKTPKDVVVHSKAGHLSKEEVTRMVEKAKEFRQEDELERERINARLTLDSLCNRFYSFMADTSNYGKDVNLREHVIVLCGETQSWVSDNPNLPKEEYEKKYREIHDECDPIRRKILNMHPDKCFKPNEETFRYDAVDE